ncbi:MAG TPA: MFS transporter [Baekduia sp.]|nr:MFS transporter [Baekduia sp.]
MTSSTPVYAAWNRRAWALLAVLCSVLFLDGLDLSMVGVALPSIEADLNLSTTQLGWVVSAYVLGYGGLLLLGGRTADLFGRKRTLIIGLAVFAAASAVGTVVEDGTLLILSRFVKGASAAFTAPAGLSLITTTFAQGPMRNRAIGIYSAFGATGFSSGLIIGGLLTEIGWRWTFAAALPVAVALLAIAPRVVPKDIGRGLSHRHYDLPGAATLTSGMLLLVYTIVEAPGQGWTSARTLASTAISLGLLALFARIESRSATPLVRLGILRSGRLLRAAGGAFVMFGAYAGFQFILTLYLQGLLGWSPLQTALAFLPAGVMIAVASLRMGALIDRFGAARLLAIGFTAFAGAYGLATQIGESLDYTTGLLPTMILLGVGFSLVFTTLQVEATTGVGDNEQGLAAGILQTSFQIGGALVMAAVSAIVSTGAGIGASPAETLDVFRTGLTVVAGLAVAGFLLSLFGLQVRFADGRTPVSTHDS